MINTNLAISHNHRYSHVITSDHEWSQTTTSVPIFFSFIDGSLKVENAWKRRRNYAALRPLFSNLSLRPKVKPTEFFKMDRNDPKLLTINPRVVQGGWMAQIWLVPSSCCICQKTKFANFSKIQPFLHRTTKYAFKRCKTGQFFWAAFDHKLSQGSQIIANNYQGSHGQIFGPFQVGVICVVGWEMPSSCWE